MYVEVPRPCVAIRMLCRIEEAAGRRGRLRVSVTINKGLRVSTVAYLPPAWAPITASWLWSLRRQ
jgi:hypothetical protein